MPFPFSTVLLVSAFLVILAGWPIAAACFITLAFIHEGAGRFLLAHPVEEPE